ncbi:Heterokaryon incompatibility [Penicillium expansum]|nr:Heterokaryon incompatibility [Penicillium expansum]
MRGDYATLSYCWGEKPFSTLNKTNYAQFTVALEMETLPPTIRDAIATTRTLSIPYLWIDALCIFQDAEEEKARDIAKMKEIYSSSALTIVAAASENVYQGFIYPRVYREILHTIPFRIGPETFGSMSINELDAACYDERFEPIARRAWTLQEQILSNSALVFTTQTMMWRCRDGMKNFGNSMYFPHDLDSGFNDNDEKYSLNLHSLLLSKEGAGNSQDTSLSCWLRLITVYSLRATSLERDRLNALAGVASHPSFFGVLGPGYFAGLWQHNLARQLTWYTSDWHRTLGGDERFTIRRPIKYRAPSWSWASLDGGVIHFDFYYDDEDEKSPDVICEIMDCSTKATSPKLNPLGEILSAQLILKSPIRRAWFNPATSNLFILPGPITSMTTALTMDECLITFEQSSQKHAKDFIDANIDSDVVEEDPEATYLHKTYFRNMLGRSDETVLCEPFLVLCLSITIKRELHDGVTGLLLVNSDDSNNNDQLKRIGSFERGRNHDFENEAKSQVCII